jgi:two-component system chemotaxis response regulator CheY
MQLSNPNLPILVVEDQKSMQRIIRSLLHQIGFADVTDAPDGAAALALLRARPFGLVISDWSMQPMGGFSLLQQVRADARLRNVPFLMITAENTPEALLAAKQAGAGGCIVKPFNADTLKSKIAAMLGGR